MKELKRNETILSQILDFQPSKSDRRRAAILDAVIDSIAYEGIDNTTSQEVGRRAKMRRSHVIYYFPNREAMIEAAVKYVVSVSQQINVEFLEGVEDSQAMLEAYVKATFAWFERHPRHAPVMAFFHYYCTFHSLYQKLYQQIQESSESRLLAILEGRKAKRGRGKAAAKLVVKKIRFVLLGSLLDYYSTEKRGNVGEREQLVIRTIRELAQDYWA